ncbi:MAG: PQQ-binding-like beta-propeller repeat protein [Candidatus Bathyarchaeia archaeon]
MRNLKMNSKLVAIFGIAIMLLSIPFAVQDVSAYTTQDSIMMGDMPTAAGSGISGSIPSGSTASVTVDARAFLSFSPQTIGIGQELLVNMWVNPPISPNRYLNGFTVTIMKPDETTFTVGPFNSFAADATAWFSFIPDVAGEWKLKFDFAGEYYPAGNWGTNGQIVDEGTTGSFFLDSAYYEPDSTEWQTLTVQEDMVWSWPINELPTDYWTRPVHYENRAWWPILGSYPGYGVIGGGSNWPADTNIYNSNYNFVPYVTAPNSAHVVYKQQQGLAGMIGGTAGQYGTSASGSPSVIYMGRAYQTMYVSINGVPTQCAVCWDIRTGEQYYAIPISQGGVTPQVVSYTAPGVGAVEGSGGDQTYSVSLISLGTRLIKINPYTGAVTLNVTGMTPQLLGGSQGSVSQTGFYADPFVISIQTIGTGANTQYRLINWTTAGTTTNFTARIMNNVSLPWGSVTYGGGLRGYAGIVADFESNVMVWLVGLAPDGLGVYHGTWMMGADMTTGQMLWNKTYTETRYSTASFTADHGLVACVMEEGSYYAYDIRTGDFKWKTEQMEYPWASAGFGAYSVQSAYGMLIRNAYNGVYAFNWTDGSTVWRFVSPAGAAFESPYSLGNESVYSFNGGGFIADGKYYTYNTEHTPSWPRTRGWKLYCIDMFTGENIWNITGAISPGAVADGYLVSGNPDDGYVYSFGKGQSQTTVTAPDLVIAKGQGIVIKGTVLDLSPAQSGTPCVSDDSMTTQMEYLHMQLPIGGIWGNATMTGVPVKLSAIDPNGNAVDIGTAISDAYSGTYAFTWTPELEGDYKIIASFEGSESYGSSSSSTGISVGAAAATPTAPVTNNDNIDALSSTMTTLTVGMGIAIIVVVALVGVMLLKKK